MSRRAARIIIEYEDGHREGAEGEDAAAIWAGILNAFAIAQLHGVRYRGPVFREMPAKGDEDDRTEVERLRAEAERSNGKLREIIAIAHEAGWNGVENSKILAVFLRDRLIGPGDQDGGAVS